MVARRARVCGGLARRSYFSRAGPGSGLPDWGSKMLDAGSHPHCRTTAPDGMPRRARGDAMRACALLPRRGMDNVTFEVDYPHSASTFPNTLARGLPGQAIRMLHLDLD